MVSDDVQKLISATSKLSAGSAVVLLTIWLVYTLSVGLREVEPRLRALEMAQTAGHQAISADLQKIRDETGRGYMVNERILNVLRAMCVNDAQTLEARRQCLIE